MSVKYINIKDVHVPESYASSHPRQEKLDAVIVYVQENNRLDRPLILNKDNVLIDNYLRYLAAQHFGMSKVPYVVGDYSEEREEQNNQTMTYVVGKFYRCPKEYTWKNPDELPVAVGDKVLVKSKDKKKQIDTVTVVTVVNVYKSNNPALKRHKPILKVYK